MSEKTTAEEAEKALTEANEALVTAKSDLQTAKSNLKVFKKDNKVKDVNTLEDAAKKTEGLALEEALTTAKQTLVKAKETVVELKPKGKRGGGETYKYGQIPGEDKKLRDLDSNEKKRWRAHARKAGKKDDISGAEVPFDADFFKPKVKVEKPVKKEEVSKEEKSKDD